MVSTTPYSLTAEFLEQLPLWKPEAERTFQRRGGGEESLIARVQLTGQPAVPSSRRPPPTISLNPMKIPTSGHFHL